MGARKYLTEIERLLEKSPVVDLASIKRIINSKKKVKQYHKQVLRNLISQGKVKQITSGKYTLHDEPSLAVFCFQPGYLGLEDALSFHNLWGQETIPVIITTRKVRQGLRQFNGMNYLVRRMDKKYFFGFDYYPSGKFYFPYSDKEKTFLDVLYFDVKLDREELQEIILKLDKKKLNGYLKKYPLWMKRRVRKTTNLF